MKHRRPRGAPAMVAVVAAAVVVVAAVVDAGALDATWAIASDLWTDGGNP